jgi:hypothetical protein
MMNEASSTTHLLVYFQVVHQSHRVFRRPSSLQPTESSYLAQPVFFDIALEASTTVRY